MKDLAARLALVVLVLILVPALPGLVLAGRLAAAGRARVEARIEAHRARCPICARQGDSAEVPGLVPAE